MTDDRVTYVTWCLLVDELDDFGESTVASSMAYLKYNVFPAIAPFSSLPDQERIQLAIDAFSSLVRDGLAAFWEQSFEWDQSAFESRRKRQREDWWDWLTTHALTALDVEVRLQRLVPLWWSGVFGGDFDYVRARAGEAVFERWVHHPPNDVALRIGAPPFREF